MNRNMKEMKELLESRKFETFIIALIVINGIILGLETDAGLMSRVGPALIILDKVILAIFTVEVFGQTGYL